MAFSIFDKSFEEKRVLYRNPNKEDFLDSSDECSEKSFKEAYVIAKISGWSTVLIAGANGVGKTGYAKLIWNESPCTLKKIQRDNASVAEDGILKDRKVLEVNCAAFSKDLIAAELFGYKRGAFTGASDDHKGKIQVAAEEYGCLFLDEVGDLPLNAQAMLLRFFQNKEIQPIGCAEPGIIRKDKGGSRGVDNFQPKVKLSELKVICATNKNLEDEVKKGNFREDLFHRINKFCVKVPPLRDRPNDCCINFENYFHGILDDFKKSVGKKDSNGKLMIPFEYKALADWLDSASIEIDAFDRLNRSHGYSWPGNFRELRNRMNQAFMRKIMEGAEAKIGFKDLFPEGIDVAKRQASREASGSDISQMLEECGLPSLGESKLPEFDLRKGVDALTRCYIDKAIAQCNGNKTKAAQLLHFPNFQMMDRRREGKS